MALVAERLQKDHPDTNASRGLVVAPLQRSYEDIGLRPLFTLWQLAAGLVLLIACVNVANLMLARGAERQREMALAPGPRSRPRPDRAAASDRGARDLGAGGRGVPAPVRLGHAGDAAAHARRDRALLAGLGRASGWTAGSWASRSRSASCATLLFTLVPAFRASRSVLTDALKEGGRSATVGATRQRGREPPGGDPGRRGPGPRGGGRPGREERADAPARSSRLRSGPDSSPCRSPCPRAAIASRPPGAPSRATWRNGWPRSPGSRASASPTSCPPGTTTRRGPSRSRASRSSTRAIRPSSTTARSPRATSRRCVSRWSRAAGSWPRTTRRRWRWPWSAARWPSATGPDAIPSADASGWATRTRPWLTVVGVSGDHIHHWFSRRNYPTCYRPYAQDPRSDLAFAVRTTGDPEALAPAARLAVSAIDPYQPSLRRVEPCAGRCPSPPSASSTWPRSWRCSEGLALVLAISGVYGVMSYRVSLRTQEIGVRVALGASAGDVLRLTMTQALRLTATGLVVGSASASPPPERSRPPSWGRSPSMR